MEDPLENGCPVYEAGLFALLMHLGRVSRSPSSEEETHRAWRRYTLSALIAR